MHEKVWLCRKVQFDKNNSNSLRKGVGFPLSKLGISIANYVIEGGLIYPLINDGATKVFIEVSQICDPITLCIIFFVWFERLIYGCLLFVHIRHNNYL